MKKEFAIIGLGRFGGSICKELSEEGMSVLAIDIDEERVNEYKNVATYAVIADTTDEIALKELDIADFDDVIVAIGDDIQASILTTVILAELGVKSITVKAQNDYHEKILNKIGAHHVVHPERDMGRRIAHSLISSNILDFLELSEDHSIVEIKASDKMLGKSLLQLDIRARYGCNVVAIQGRNNEMNVSPNPADKIQGEDILIIIGSNKDINKLEKDLLYG